MLLIGIGVQVEQLALVGRAQIQLPTVSGHDGPPGHSVQQIYLRVAQVAVSDAVVLDENVVSVQRSFASQDIGPTHAVKMLWHRLAKQLKQRGHEIDLRIVPCDHALLFVQPGYAHQKRHLGGGLVKRAHLQHAVGADEVAVLAGEHDDGVVCQPCIVHGTHDLAHCVVDQRDVGKVVGPEPAPRRLVAYIVADERGMRVVCVAASLPVGFRLLVGGVGELGLHEEVGPNPIEQGCALRLLEESGVHRQRGGIVQMVVRSGERRMRLQEADVHHEGAILVLV